MNCLCSTSRHSRNPPPSCHPPQHNFRQISKNSHHPLLHPDGKIFQRRHPETAGSQTQPGSKCLLRFPAYKCNLCSRRRRLNSSSVESTRFTSYHVRAHLFVFSGQLGCHENKTTPIPNRFVGDIRAPQSPLSPERNSSRSECEKTVGANRSVASCGLQRGAAASAVPRYRQSCELQSI